MTTQLRPHDWRTQPDWMSDETWALLSAERERAASPEPTDAHGRTVEDRAAELDRRGFGSLASMLRALPPEAADSLADDLIEAVAKVADCPRWCTLPADHGWDENWPDGRRSRTHAGPYFSSQVDVYRRDYSDGERLLGVTLADMDTLPRDLTTEDARALARHLCDAATWCERTEAAS